MRFFGCSAAVFAAVTLLSGVNAVPQSSSAVTSATQTVTITRTVSRVVQTEYSTSTPSATSYESTSSYVASTGVIPAPYGGNNGTVSASGTGSPAGPTAAPTYMGAAGHVDIQSFGVVAVAGLLGLMAI